MDLYQQDLAQTAPILDYTGWTCCVCANSVHGPYLLYCHRLSEVSWLVDIGSTHVPLRVLRNHNLTRPDQMDVILLALLSRCFHCLLSLFCLPSFRRNEKIP